MIFQPSYFGGNGGVRNSKFKEQIRIYNSLFQFTSLGGIVDNSINQRPGLYVFKLLGQNYHRMGSLLPFAGQTSKFSQLYMIESDAELDCRMSCFRFNDDEYNDIVKVFLSAREVHMQFRELPVRIKLIANRNKKDHNYSAPLVPEIAALIVGDIGNNYDQWRDIIVEHKQEGLKRISDLHPLFMPLQYPLLFPYGEDCFHLNIPYEKSPIRRGRLFQQFIVDCYAIIEDTRLRYIREHQTSLRTEMYKTCNSIGKRIILPASFIPGPRYMFEKYQDAMAICRFFGYPKLFITFTCNPRWSEITDTLSSILGQRPEDRPDIVSRVFRIKVRHLMDDLIKNHHFGPLKAVFYIAEFQKRGLPHVHILLWLEKESGIMTASEIDNIVSAELPDKRSDPIGYDAVSSFMLHGPCGLANSQAPCMENGKCKKFYPKAFRNSTTIDEDVFPQYRRRDLPASTSQNGIKLDNRFVVPHNVDLVVRYQAHINVEICNLTRAVKYLFKYICKGLNRARIQNYLDCRYLSAHESCWRLFEFPFHHRELSVQRLLIHLPEEHNIYFSDKQFIPNIISIPGIETTMFTEWMATNKLDERGRSLLYTDFPTKFTWRAILFALIAIKGARSYEDLRTINNVVYTTYREACFALGILGDDSEWSNALIQAAHWATGTQLRQLFVTIILYCDVGDKKALFDKHWQLISEDIHYRLRRLAIYTQIQGAINNNRGMFFVYGHGGTGKTFLWNTIINGIRTEGKIVLAVASFKIPINIEECSTCKISKQTQLTRLIEKTTLIVWDEAPMVHRNCLEALNKNLQDLLSETTPEASTKPFGGKAIVLGGDFRQILPVIQYGSKEDIINATITQSQLWKECKVLKLNTNMRLHRNNLNEESRDQFREFAEWLLQIGDGTIASIERNHNDLDEGDWIEIPQYLLVENLGNPIQSIIEAIYPQFQLNYAKTEYLRQRAIVTPYNETVDILNETISNEIEADEQKYLSSDYISKASTSADANAPLYTTEFLNTLKFAGIPNHELTLKIGCVIMLIRNISQTNGLCNGTRLIITQMHHNILEAVIISGSNIGDKVYIHRIIMPVQEGKWPFIMCRKQFLVKLSYAMTINKSQGQTLELVGLFLPKPAFSHGQLYVALSRVSSVEGLKVLILDDNGKNTNKTKNVVYKEIFDSIEINSDPGR
ncbi:DNA helicase protein [Dioscorea alata]|uniref:DNA helicase protein n=1 Tax=Dioscorea alata TaxID=55571 RepID=A0ACB7V1B8_DIOAL|nr:DNA helicase protein [Dioscorea alata]